MKTKAGTIQVSDSIGRVSTIFIEAEDPHYMLVLAHGAGAGMDHSFMTSLSMRLAENKISTLRYNFPYMEAKKKRVDPGPIAEKTVGAAVMHAGGLAAGLPLFVSGKSFGGRMSSHFLSKHPDQPVKGLIFYGFPLHAAGQPGITRGEHLSNVKIPMLFLQGSRDALADITLMTQVTTSLPFATLEVFQGADHSFKAGKTDLIPLLASTTAKWMEAGVKTK